MKIGLYIATMLSFISFSGISQVFQDTIHVEIAGKHLETASDGDFFLAGYDITTDRPTIVRNDQYGNRIWTDTWQGAGDGTAFADIIYDESEDALYGVSIGLMEFVFKLDAITGDTIWAYEIETSAYPDFHSNVADIFLSDSVVYLNYTEDYSWSFRLTAINKFTGSVICDQLLNDPSMGPGQIRGENDLINRPLQHGDYGHYQYSNCTRSDSISLKANSRIIDYLPNGDTMVVVYRADFDQVISVLSKNKERNYESFLKDTLSRYNSGVSIHSIAVLESHVFLGGVGSFDYGPQDYGGDYFLTCHNLETGELIWDTAFDLNYYRFWSWSSNNSHFYLNGNYLDSLGSHVDVYKINLAYFNDLLLNTDNQSKELNALHFYPNPTSSTLKINFEQAQEATIGIYSLTGALLLQKQVNTQNAQLDVSGLPEGMYVVQVKTAQGVESQKVVISR
jgi:hypothetical protein